MPRVQLGLDTSPLVPIAVTGERDAQRQQRMQDYPLLPPPLPPHPLIHPDWRRFVLHLDSHIRMVARWDIVLAQQLAAAERVTGALAGGDSSSLGRVVLTAYPAPYLLRPIPSTGGAGSDASSSPPPSAGAAWFAVHDRAVVPPQLEVAPLPLADAESAAAPLVNLPSHLLPVMLLPSEKPASDGLPRFGGRSVTRRPAATARTDAPAAGARDLASAAADVDDVRAALRAAGVPFTLAHRQVEAKPGAGVEGATVAIGAGEPSPWAADWQAAVELPHFLTAAAHPPLPLPAPAVAAGMCFMRGSVAAAVPPSHALRHVFFGEEAEWVARARRPRQLGGGGVTGWWCPGVSVAWHLWQRAHRPVWREWGGDAWAAAQEERGVQAVKAAIDIS